MGSPWQQVVDKVAGATAESSHLEAHIGSRESRLKMTQVFTFSKPIPSDKLPPVRSHLLIFPRQGHCLELSTEMPETMGGISHSNHHSALESNIGMSASEAELAFIEKKS